MIKKRKSMTPEKVEAVLLKDMERRKPNLVRHEGFDIKYLTLLKLQNFYVKGVSLEKSRGVLADIDGKPMLYYVWADSAIIMSKVQILATTYQNTYHLALQDKVMTLTVNGQIVGYHQYESGAIFNQEKKLIGVINRYTGNRTLSHHILRNYAFEVARQNEESPYPIEFLSGTKALLTNKYHPTTDYAVQYTGNISKNEQHWLVALAINYISGALWE